MPSVFVEGHDGQSIEAVVAMLLCLDNPEVARPDPVAVTRASTSSFRSATAALTSIKSKMALRSFPLALFHRLNEQHAVPV